jgi:hypothetical protein
MPIVGGHTPMTAQDFVDYLNVKEFLNRGYVLVRKEKGLFWEYAYYGHTDSYAANETTRKAMKEKA